MTIKDMKIQETARITKVGGEGALRQHFLDMGVIPGAEITVIKYAPLGDPIELMIHGYELTLRLEDAARIEVEPLPETAHREKIRSKKTKTSHPGLGEGGKYHSKSDIEVYAKDAQLLFGLDRKSTRLNSSHTDSSRMPSSA